MTTIYTVGHSNRDLESFLDLLGEFGIGVVADIRRFPSSRKFPHFNRGNLEKSLANRKIDYRWLEAMGGRRHGSNSSRQEGLLSPAFRSFAEHMNGFEFREAASALFQESANTRVAIMCAEKLFWKCHRMLISDYLTGQGTRVVHILEPGRSQEHKVSSSFRLLGDGSVVYKLTNG